MTNLHIKTVVTNALLTLLVFTLFGCNVSAPPDPIVSEYFKTEGGGFIISNKHLQGSIMYKIIKSIEFPKLFHIEFETYPKDSPPFTIEKIIKNNSQPLTFKSPPYTKIKNNQNYQIKLEVYDVEKKTLFTTHTQHIQLKFDAKSLKFIERISGDIIIP